MKTARFLLMAFVAMLSVGMVSCGKDNGGDNPGGGQNVGQNWVDLGLPSGLLWADKNEGAFSPAIYGNYFAWGETNSKDVYNWSTYRYCTVDDEGNLQTLTKYIAESRWGTPDSLTTLEASDEAVIGWRTPTLAEWEELNANTTAEWVIENGLWGYKFTGSNGNSIFLPAAGYRRGSELVGAGEVGYYMTSSLYTGDSQGSWNFYFNSGAHVVSTDVRCWGYSVRSVRQK